MSHRTRTDLKREPSTLAASSERRPIISGIPRPVRLAIVCALLVSALAASAAASAAPPPTVAAYYYPWYGPGGTSWSLGYARAQLAPPEAPALGEYDSRDPAVVAQHYAWAQEYGVDVFVCSWSGPGSFTDRTLREALLPSPARGPTRLAILYESLQRLSLGPDARIHLDDAAIATLVSDFAYLARTSFSDPGYYRIDGRPVVVLYASRIYRGPVAEAIRAVRAAVEAVAGVDPFLIGDEVDVDTADPPDRSRLRLFDAITAYTPYSRLQREGWPDGTGFLASVGARMRAFRDAAAAARVGFVPDVLPGFDDRGLRPADGHHVLPRQLGPTAGSASLFETLLGQARGLVDRSLRLVAVTSWNEWFEDSQIEPTAPAPPSDRATAVTEGYPFSSYGTSLLETLARYKASWERASRGGPALPS